MPHYKLVASGRRPELNADEIVLSRHEDSGEPEHKLSTRTISEIPEELLGKARNLAHRLGFQVVETEPGAENSEDDGQEAGSDSAGQAPAVTSVDQSGAKIDQQETARQGARAPQQNAPAGTSSTTPNS